MQKRVDSVNATHSKVWTRLITAEATPFVSCLRYKNLFLYERPEMKSVEKYMSCHKFHQRNMTPYGSSDLK